MSTVEIGDILYHHTDKPFDEFRPDASNVVFLGTTKESVDLVGGVGFLLLFQVIDTLGKAGIYGSRDGFGQNGKWVSLPAEVAAESLQLVETISEYNIE